MHSYIPRHRILFSLSIAVALFGASDLCSAVDVRESPATSETASASAATSFKEAMTRGEALFKSKQYDDARIQFDRAIDLDPKSGSAYLWRAQVNCRAKRTDAELADLAKAVALLPDELSWRTHLAQLMLSKKQYVQASAEARAVLLLNPSNIEAASVEIRAYLESRLPDRYPAYRRVLWNYEEQAQFLKQGRNYLAESDLVNAMLAFTRSAALDKLKNVPASESRRMRAEVMIAKGEFDRAFAEHKLIITDEWTRYGVAPSSKEQARILISSWVERKDYERAIELDLMISQVKLKDSWHLSEIRSESLLRRASNLELLNRIPEAREVMLAFVSVSPQHPSSHIVMAKWHHEHGETKSVIEEYGIAISLAKESVYAKHRAEAFLCRGKIREAQGDLYRALADYEGALEAEDKNVEAIRGQQRIAATVNVSDANGALEDFKKALGDLEKLIPEE